MLKFNILTIGKIKEKYFTEAIKEYEKRISRFATVKIIELPEANDKLPLEKIIDKESQSLLDNCKGNVIVLDIKGENLDSEELSSYVDKVATKGESEITVVIGGSNGFNENVRKRANLRLSFGKITFPHQLIRVVVLEQIYRIMTIKNNIAYHK